MADEKPQQGLEPIKTHAPVRAKANGLNGSSGPPSTTDKWLTAMEGDDELALILRKVRRAWIRGLDSSSEKIAVDTAHKLSGHLFRPDAKIKVEHSGDAGGNTTYNVVNLDMLSVEERALLARAQKHIGLETSGIIDVDAVEE